MNTFLFFLVLSLPGSHPVMHDHQTATLVECLDEVRDALEKMRPPSDRGGVVQAGCLVTQAPSVEN